ncbi:hypothetical protein QBC39DRAFT_260787 [Podospora conica]|nr:hypothetical protein QBC39DRAFT_260787 [Schizothecium conicum]
MEGDVAADTCIVVTDLPGLGATESYTTTARRSTRARKPPRTYEEESETASIAGPLSPKSAENTPTPAVRRNAKRKAAPEVFVTPENIIEASLQPWEENEQAEWPSWTELESDPALFNGVLRLLGITGAKIEEVLSVDEEYLAQLPAPVYGLIFLYQYVSEESPEADEKASNIWFANQTTNSACATIAMLNIVMNAEGLDLGEKLQDFKQDSKDLAPPLRGNLISNNQWIRMAHNSFARRFDLLNAALSLDNDVEESKKKKRPRSTATRVKKKKKPETSNAYHFIAFVPVGQSVWQLDGLEASPVHVAGDFEQGAHWTSAARPVIEARMIAYETEQLSFSLLAMCRDGMAEEKGGLSEYDTERILGPLLVEAALHAGGEKASSGAADSSTPEANDIDISVESQGTLDGYLTPRKRSVDVVVERRSERREAAHLDTPFISPCYPPGKTTLHPDLLHTIPYQQHRASRPRPYPTSSPPRAPATRRRAKSDQPPHIPNTTTQPTMSKRTSSAAANGAQAKLSSDDSITGPLSKPSPPLPSQTPATNPCTSQKDLNVLSAEGGHFSLIKAMHLADLITEMNGLCGILSIFSSLRYCAGGDPTSHGNLWAALSLLPLGLFFDFFDGKVARWRHKSSLMGQELDSLADLISFGVAPAVVAFSIGIRTPLDHLCLAFFVLCGLTRLARFNVTAASIPKDATGKAAYFEGTPIPTTLGLDAMMGWWVSQGWIHDAVPGGVWLAGTPLEFHPVVLVFMIHGCLMTSKSIHVPKP